jgi:threonine synthase
MKFISLGNSADAVSFEEALNRGIARDGSLYVPETVPKLSSEDLAKLPGANRYEIAEIMLKPFVGDEIPLDDLVDIIHEAASFDTPVVQVGDKQVLEMWHGPTMAFKDVAAGYLAAFMSYFNQKAGRRSTVLVATSGDTGGAIAQGFAGAANLDLVLLYPKGRVSRLQREQLRRVAKNVRSIEVDGDFNDCQQLVKQAFTDQKLSEKLNLTSANSINIGRLLPQTTYYASLYAQLPADNLRVVVPTGNLGNLSAGLLARSMGVPIPKFIAANNMNDSLARYLDNGLYEQRPTIRTMSNAMDVNLPNNLPRFMWIFDNDLSAVRQVVEAVKVTDEETVETIKRVHAETGYLLDPHTAVGWRASEVLASDEVDVVVATASPLKFAEEIYAKTGISLDNTHLITELSRQPERYTSLDNSLDQLKEFLTGSKI